MSDDHEPKASFEHNWEYRSSKRTRADRNQQKERPKKVRLKTGFTVTVVPNDDEKRNRK